MDKIESGLTTLASTIKPSINPPFYPMPAASVFKTIGQWRGINRKQSTRRQHLSRLKASAFFSLQIFFSCYEKKQHILGIGTAIWWVTEPH
jgi:hypothetical protein